MVGISLSNSARRKANASRSFPECSETAKFVEGIGELAPGKGAHRETHCKKAGSLRIVPAFSTPVSGPRMSHFQ
jgi:hypothetical protein